MQAIIHLLKEEDLGIIQSLAHEIWPLVYADILHKDQIEYMLAQFYSLDALALQMEEGSQFFLLTTADKPIGFFAIQTNHPSVETMRLHKLYLLPNYHGQGFGKYMLQAIENNAHLQGMKRINLNVNKYNPTIALYKKVGYSVLFAEDISIGGGYLMEDYQMEKVLN